MSVRLGVRMDEWRTENATDSALFGMVERPKGHRMVEKPTISEREGPSGNTSAGLARAV